MSAIFGETLGFSQENGPEVRLRVYGDEFYARYETEDGYTAIYDVDLGLFCYCVLIKGEFVSSGVDLSLSPQIKSGSISKNRSRSGTASSSSGMPE